MTRTLKGRRYTFKIEADTEPEPQEDKVEPRAACPQCHENRADHLEVREDNSVQCSECGTVYEV